MTIPSYPQRDEDAPFHRQVSLFLDTLSVSTLLNIQLPLLAPTTTISDAADVRPHHASSCLAKLLCACFLLFIILVIMVRAQIVFLNDPSSKAIRAIASLDYGNLNENEVDERVLQYIELMIGSEATRDGGSQDISAKYLA